MGTAQGMLAEARKSLGLTGRPNYITRDYASRHGEGFLSAAWCDMGITWWARRSDNATAVLPAGDRAYTPWHAEDFRKIGRWHPGTTAEVDRAEPGDIAFFDWGGTNDIGAIDHVGVVEKALGGGLLQTIEANTGNAVKRRVRGAADIAGYGRPAYGEDEDMPTAKEIAEAVWEYQFAAPWATGEDRIWQAKTHLSTCQTHVRNAEKLVAGLAAREPDGVDVQAIVAGLLVELTPDKIADAVAESLPADMAEQVVTALGQRIGGA